MTFYNVLSALLFLGALRVLLLAFEALNWRGIFTSGCLAILVFNDMLSTSYTIESEKQTEYTMPLMLLDLFNFLLLALAMIVISPGANLFDIPLPKVAAFLRPSSFWLLLTVYWFLLIWWTSISWEPPSGQRRRILFFQFSVALAFLIEWLLYIAGWTTAAGIGNVVVPVYIVIYLLFIRRFAWRAPT